jgi:DNA polymerase
MLAKLNLTRNKVFITNLVHFRPPGNRDPTDAEMRAFKPYVDKMIEIIKPKLLITLGRFSMGKFLPNAKISEVHGQIKNIKWNKHDMIMVPMYHPAAALRREDIRLEFEKDFIKLKEIIEKI